MNKEQQIEEIAKDINNTWFVKSNGDICGTNVKLKKNDIKMIAHQLVLEGYRKIPKDSVVLSKEEQEQMNNELRDKIYQACKLENQKTAEKIINYFIKEFPILKTRVIARELAKQYGVEIKE